MPKDKTYVYNVEMTCGGCSGAVERVLQKHGVSNFDVDLVNKKVEVTTSLTSDEMLEILKKSGKPVSFVGEK